MRAPIRTFALIAIALVPCFGLSAVPAHAEEIKLIGEIGNSGAGHVVNVGGVAVNQDTNDVYVADIEGNRVIEYAPGGELILMFGRGVNQTEHEGPLKPGETVQQKQEKEDICTAVSGDTCVPGQAGSAAGQFNQPSGVAVDPVSGDVYVGDDRNDRVQRFTENGEYVSEIDSGVEGNPFIAPPEYRPDVAVQANGNPLVLSFFPGSIETDVLEFYASGKYTGVQLGQQGTSEEFAANGIAVGQDGLVYVATANVGGGSGVNHGIFEFSPVTHGLVGELPQTTASLGVTVDPFTGDVFAVDPLEASGEVVEFSSAGVRLASYPLPLNNIRGATYDVSEGKLYVSDQTLGRVSVFGPFPRPPKAAPTIAGESLLGLSQSAVTFSARFTANGEPTTYSFQYARNEAFSEGVQNVAASPAGGSGFGAQTARATVALEPDRVYYYRAVAHSPFGTGAPVYGPTQSFTTPALAPAAATGETTSLTYNSATLSGTVTPSASGPVADTRWCFQYGTSTAYEQGSFPVSAGDAGQGTGSVPVSAELTSLWPGTVYHYRLVAVDSLGLGLGSPVCGTAGGVETAGADATFTTPLPPAPAVTTGAASEIGTGGATISGAVETHGVQSSYEFDIGTDTSYGVRIFGSAPPLFGAQRFAVSLPNLEPGTTYHYRIVASSLYGASYGEDRTLTTPTVASSLLSAPPTPALLVRPTIAFPGAGATTGAMTTRSTPKALTNAQKLAKALRGCRKQPKRTRTSCEQHARRTYGPKRKSKAGK